MWTSDRRAALLVLLLAGQSALAQYATGEEHPLRPEPTGGGKVITPRTDQNTAAAPAEPAEQTAPIGDNIDAYTAAQIVEQAKAEAAAKAATAATNQETTAQPAPETTTAQPQPEAAPNNEDDPAFALLPVEKLSPAAPPTETVIIERAIYRCAQGNKNVYVDADAKKRYSKCTLFRAEKTAEVPVGGNNDAAPKTTGSTSSCSGTLNYKGSTYLFQENQPCPIPDNIFKNLVPAASNR